MSELKSSDRPLESLSAAGRSRSTGGVREEPGAGEPKALGKPFEISKWEVWEAWLQVQANQGASGVDGCSIEEFEKDLEGNLYKVWNRMSSGSYFPPPVRAVEIPKPHGDGVRVLGVPTVGDRVAQTVAAARLGAKVEPIFHPDSYGYRPGRSQLDAVRVCRERCWRRDWVIDLDVQKFFDTVPWDLVVAAVEAHLGEQDRWVALYVKRWLAAPLALPDGTVQKRDRGTPQGSAISPVLANLFMHYAFDTWMEREFPSVAFERYADDVVVHCATARRAREVLAAIESRMAEVGLRLHPAKTRIVYCKDGTRRGSAEHTSFDFLGYTFRARGARGEDRRVRTSFLPAISKDALNKISREVWSWRLHRKTGQDISDIARWINPIARGWMNYYGEFYRSEMYPLLQRINAYLMRWLRKKFKRLKTLKKAKAAWKRMTIHYPRGFAQWEWVTGF